jgi:hypothetical protein
MYNFVVYDIDSYGKETRCTFIKYQSIKILNIFTIAFLILVSFSVEKETEREKEKEREREREKLKICNIS